jgi:Ser/Thr protein kinase RdoA (MazF antagonist)
MRDVDAESIAERFGLGRPLGEPVVAAAGWGERNRLWRLETTTGVFAVKDTVAELLPDDSDAAFRIELAAHDAGIPSASPVRSIQRACFERLDGRWYRCHRWVEGVAKQNEDTTSDEGYAMGAVVAALHGLAIPAGPPPPANAFGQQHWLELARRRPHATWARSIQDHIDDIDASETIGSSVDQGSAVGSHRDLNAHNVLFTSDGPVLIDWDAAGPASVIYERVSTAVLWAQRRGGVPAVDVALGFLRGYLDSGGVVERDDAAALPLWLSAVTWWTERNVQIAITEPSEHHDQLATLLVDALTQGVKTVTRRQLFLNTVFAHL